MSDGFDQASDPSVPTSAVVRLALRVARLRNDWKAILRMEIELRPSGNEEAKRAVAAEVAAHFTRDELTNTWNQTVEDFAAGRRMTHPTEADKEVTLGDSVGEIETRIIGLREQAANLPEPAGPNETARTRDANRIEKVRADLLLSANSQEQILARVRERAAAYLSVVEREIVFGQVSADIFERNRQWVDAELRERAPQVLEQFAAAYRRRYENDAEARAHALTSCRRVLSTLADVLYPPSAKPATGADGRERPMGQEAYINRLLQYATDAQMGSRSREILQAQIRLLGDRLASVNGLASKGVHAEVTAAEVDQCLIQTYLAAGDLLRLAADDSGAQQPEAA